MRRDRQMWRVFRGTPPRELPGPAPEGTIVLMRRHRYLCLCHPGARNGEALVVLEFDDLDSPMSAAFRLRGEIDSIAEDLGLDDPRIEICDSIMRRTPHEVGDGLNQSAPFILDRMRTVVHIATDLTSNQIRALIPAVEFLYGVAP